MANTLTGLIPTLYEALDVVSRELVGLIPAVTLDAQVARAAKGQTVDSFVTPAVTASDITPGVTAPNDGDQVIGNVPITITRSRYIPIRWNGEEQRGLNNGGPGSLAIMRNQFAQAFRTLVNEVETDLAMSFKQASRATGTPGTTPFGVAGDLSDFANVRQILEDNGAPTSDLHMVLGSAAISKIRGKQNVLFRVNESGTDALLRQGVIGEVEGMMVHNSAQIRTFTAGTGTGYLVNNAAGYAVGAQGIAVDTGSGTILTGDVVTLAGDSNKYVVTAGNPTAPATSMVLGSPGLRLAVADNTAITLSGSYVPNIGFARSAIVLATRTPAVPVDMSGRAIDMADDRTIVIDPVSGLAFEVSLYTQYRQIKYEVALAWGSAVVKPDHIAVLQG